MIQSAAIDFNEPMVGEVNAVAMQSLPAQERCVVWVWRQGFEQCRRGELVAETLAPLCEKMGWDAALCAFDHAVEAMSRLPLRALAIGGAGSRWLTRDETRILQALAFLQRGRAPAAAKILGEILSPCGVKLCIPAFARIAAVLDSGGLQLALPNRS